MARLSALLLAVLIPLAAGQWDPNVVDPRSAIVHLFEWRWNDIADECERFLGPMGYAGVQTSPPNENVVAVNEYANRPWWERYQPVSYKLITRSGTEDEFASMVSRCNAVGVRVYPDIVINHMSGYWPGGTGATGGSSFDAGSLQYPIFGPNDFHGSDDCPTSSGNIENYSDAVQVRNCKLVGLNDLDGGSEYVRNTIAEFLNRLIGYGVAGFRVDASKHMWPGDMQAIFGRLNDLSTAHGFPAGTRPFIFMEVIDLGGEAISQAEYYSIGRVTEFKYGAKLGEIFRRYDQLQYLSNFGEAWGMAPGNNALVFIDNHDNQRGHGAGGQNIITFREPQLYKMAVAFMLAWPYGFPRVMSSYYWDQNWVNGQDKNDWIGPPVDGNMNTLPVVVNPDDTCGNGWICEHRWRQIYNMVKFRNVAGAEKVVNFSTGTGQQIAFSRGSKAFIAINNDEGATFSGSFPSGLPSGQYCDVISGNLVSGSCTGKTITVNGDGTVNVDLPVPGPDGDRVLAIHVEAKL
jgi:alpha-amylase